MRLATPLLALLALLGCAGVAGAQSRPSVVVLRTAEVGDTAHRLGDRIGFRPTRHVSRVLRAFAADLTLQQIGRLRTDPAVAYVTADISFTATGTVSTAAGETVPAGIRRARAATATSVHAPATTGVAVLDTGLDLKHSDLSVAGGINCISPGGALQDDNGHGTHIGGIIAGRNNGAGIAGVAPGTRLYAVKVLNAKKTGTLSQILCGLDWLSRNAAGLGIRVANLSFSAAGQDDGNCGRTNYDPIHTAVCNLTAAGVLSVVSAGNSGTALGSTTPAAYREVLAATAMTDTDGAPGAKGPLACGKSEKDDTPWTGTNHGTTAADQAHLVAAPGACVLSSRNGGGTVSMTGTSMAAPHVAGTVALCIGNGGVAGPCSGLAPVQTIDRIRADADAAAAAGFGFSGDLRTPVAGRIHGNLVSAAAY